MFLPRQAYDDYFHLLAAADVLLDLHLEENRELLAEFYAEAVDHLQQIEAALLVLDHEPGNQESLNSIFRSFHTIKGNAGFLGRAANQEFSSWLASWGSSTGEAGNTLNSIMRTWDADLGTGAANRHRYSNPDLDALIELGEGDLVAESLSAYPAATQDLSLVVPVDVPAGDVRATVIEGAGELLEAATLIDDYRGDGLEAGTKSITLALRFRAADRTLTQAEATEAKMAGLAVAAERFGASLRA